MAEISKQFVFQVPDAPGEFAKIATTLDKSGVSIEGIESYTFGGQGYIYLWTKDFSSTASVLDNANITYNTEDVLITSFPNTPGTCGKYTQALADAGININWMYTNGTREIMSTDNLKGAQTIAGELENS